MSVDDTADHYRFMNQSRICKKKEKFMIHEFKIKVFKEG